MNWLAFFLVVGGILGFALYVSAAYMAAGYLAEKCGDSTSVFAVVMSTLVFGVPFGIVAGLAV